MVFDVDVLVLKSIVEEYMPKGVQKRSDAQLNSVAYYHFSDHEERYLILACVKDFIPYSSHGLHNLPLWTRLLPPFLELLRGVKGVKCV